MAHTDTEFKQVAEIVLPSGKFATMRVMTMGDIACAFDTNPYVFFIHLLSHIARVEDHDVSIDDIAAMDATDVQPMIAYVAKKLEQLRNITGGVA